MSGESVIELRNKMIYGIGFKLLLRVILSISLSAGFIALAQSIVISLAGISAQSLSMIEEDYSFMYFAVFLIIAALLFFLLSKGLISRLISVNSAMGKVIKGDTGVHLPVHSADEIGELSGNINQIVNQLREKIESQKRAEQSKNEMIAHISHDLRTPLTSLLGYLELIQEHAQDQEACSRYIQVARRKGTELKDQIEEMLEYSYLNLSSVELTFEKLDAEELIQQVVIDFMPQLENEGMVFEMEIEGEIPCIKADSRLLVRLLQNIVSNAVNYGKAGGRLTFRLHAEGTELVVQMINYGDPIPPEDLPYVFENFYRGEKSRSSHTGGKGMGLAIAKSIAELHHGSITLQSNTERTCFTLRLPGWRIQDNEG